MNFSFSRNPNNLKCPACGTKVPFVTYIQVITCPVCACRIRASKQHKQLKLAGVFFLVLPGVLVFVLDLELDTPKTIATVFSLLLGFALFMFANGKADMLEIDE